MTTSPATDKTLHEQDCADEPIRVPGAIQPHGFLLGLDESNSVVLLASENASSFLKTPSSLILNATVDHVLPRELLGVLRQHQCLSDPQGMITYLGNFQVGADLFSVLTHCADDLRLLEFELLDRLVGAEMMNSVITNFVGALSKIETEQELCDAVTAQVAQLTGFDRVLLYSFDVEGHGTVLSEVNNGRLPSYLDLRFPSTDIPQQARELYVLNTHRIIPNATYTPSPLQSSNGQPARNLDLSRSVLRSVSPIHLEYMRNMGTASSMSVSIVSEGRLWGLISGHHAEPRLVPYLLRSACDMLSKLVGTQLTTFRTTASLQTLTSFHAVQRQLLTRIAAEFDYLSALANDMESVRQVTDASGVALWTEGQCHTAGPTPPTSDIARIVEWLDGSRHPDVFITRQLSSEIPWAADLADTASGLLAIRISDIRQRYILWFRPQVIRTVRWAGEPVKEARTEGASLHPRRSFEVWREVFRGQSTRWTNAEVESAREFRGAINTVSLRRAEEEAELSNARFEQLTHALPEKIFTADDNGQLTYVNSRWQEQGLGTSGLWYGEGRLDPEDEARIAERWQSALQSGSPFEEEVRVPSGPDQSPRWNLVRVVPFRRRGAARAGWVGSVIDLTERREAEAALRMTEKLALTGRMTSVIAHEINNPLEAITNLLFLVRSELEEGTETMQYVTQAESELERISGITKQTLRWGRENSQAPENFAIGAVFADVLRLFAGKIRNRGITVTVTRGSEISVRGILGQIRQVVANLVSNAVDASRPGGNVWLEAMQLPGGATAMTVRDEGVGISPEQQRELFKPFFSTKGDLGNGLGLYISNEIVERHGGKITVNSTTGHGTTVRVELPSRFESSPSIPVASASL